MHEPALMTPVLRHHRVIDCGLDGGVDGIPRTTRAHGLSVDRHDRTANDRRAETDVPNGESERTIAGIARRIETQIRPNRRAKLRVNDVRLIGSGARCDRADEKGAYRYEEVEPKPFLVHAIGLWREGMDSCKVADIDVAVAVDRNAFG